MNIGIQLDYLYFVPAHVNCECELRDSGKYLQDTLFYDCYLLLHSTCARLKYLASLLTYISAELHAEQGSLGKLCLGG